ncbi:MAG TPA: copper-binding protein [Paucimonas sp.]|nr:copper-binding protein [Paucimonas sp.]
MKSIVKIIVAAALGWPAVPYVFANDAHRPPAAEAAAATNDGEVKKIDKAAGKITIKHGPLASLDMPPMTMVFRVQEPGMLDKVKAGDKIKFVAQRVDGVIMVTRLEAAQ